MTDYNISKVSQVVEWCVALKRIQICETGPNRPGTPHDNRLLTPHRNKSPCRCGLRLIPIWGRCEEREDKVRRTFNQSYRVEPNDTN